ncbi:gibberellin 2-beta-dioxygenase 8 [Humulus lupulus]|uniref:gibberellin 2-beta-dioxygenase 8 n=1 Tax=Humulus lupulus TaxID=3486 RepID=UPI002B40EC29|nr:gibberellin 2-beta-dioxygenase 8 [Humulus lupulus]
MAEDNTTKGSSSSPSNSSSYPPPFRQLVVDSAESEQVNSEVDSDSLVPVLDYNVVNYGDGSDGGGGLGEACRDWGIFRLVNHGVPPTLLSQLHGLAKQLFSLPFETKQAILTSPLSYFWGTPVLSPSGVALSVIGSQNTNWVEGLNVPLSQLSQIQAQDHPILNSFRILLEEYGKHLGRLARSIFENMAKNLNLDTSESGSKLSEPSGFIRVYRYPPYSESNEDHPAWGMDVHTDSSVLSILSQDRVGGLQVLKNDQWFTVKPISNTLIVNLGDMMQAISNDEYKSVKHRVKVNQYRERVSICYFVFPGEGSVIRSSNYKPFTYSDFQKQVQQDVKALGYKVGLDRFKLLSTAITEAC